MNLGEPCLAVFVTRLTEAVSTSTADRATEIVVVGRRSIFVVRQDGGGSNGGAKITVRAAPAHGSEAPSALRAQRRLGYTPLCGCIVGADGTSTTGAPEARAGPGERLVVCAPGADTGYGG